MLNSKAEFNRCYLPRLRLVDEQEVTEMELAEERLNVDVEEELQRREDNWVAGKTAARSRRKSSKKVGRSLPTKTLREQVEEARPSKRRRYALIAAGWGMKTTGNAAKTTLGAPTPCWSRQS